MASQRTNMPICALVASAEDCAATARYSITRHDGDTFRAVYTVGFETAAYVLHAFQKKARRGIATPKQELDLVRRRLQAAERHYRDTHRGD